MSWSGRRILLSLSLTLSMGVVITTTQTSAPRIWDDRSLADWAMPIASLNLRPAHFSAAEYYAAREDNYRTYPVYHPDSEPAGYWDELNRRKPEPLVDVTTINSNAEWIAAGERAFRDMDAVLSRSSDPTLIAQARDPRAFEGVLKLNDGTAFGPRWVVTPQGVQIGFLACGGCHFAIQPDRSVRFGGPGGPVPPGTPPLNPRGNNGALATRRFLEARFPGDTIGVALWRQWSVPWDPDDRVERIRNIVGAELAPLIGQAPGTSPRVNGSPFFTTKVPDLRLLRYYRYIDATGTHRLRGPEDVARYAALITGADPMTFGPHRMLNDAQRKVSYRYADAVLYAIGTYLLSLEPPKNPSPPPADLVARGEQVFRREQCGTCHPAPDYTTGELTPALGYDVPANHLAARDVRARTVGTDAALALRTRKGTGFYKIPSLRGLWYRPLLLHDGSIVSLEELFDPARLDPEYERKGWSPPGVTKGAILGLEFLTKLSPDDRTALIAFLRSL
jgi:mono/diheme cytochrome c family protein